MSKAHPSATVQEPDRVAQGGHDIPEPVIRRRFATGQRNFRNLYKPLADAWRHYDNAGELPVLLASSDKP